MITEDQFVNRVFDKFDEMGTKIDKNHTDVSGKIQNLCDKQTELENKFNTHLKVEAALEQYKKDQKEGTSKKFYVLMAIMGIAFTAYELITS